MGGARCLWQGAGGAAGDFSTGAALDGAADDGWRSRAARGQRGDDACGAQLALTVALASLAFELAACFRASLRRVDRLGEACEAYKGGFLAGSGSGSFWQVSAARLYERAAS